MISFYQIAWGKILTNHRAHFKVTSTPLCKYFIYFFSHCKQTYTYTPSTSKWPASSQPLSLSLSLSLSLPLSLSPHAQWPPHQAPAWVSSNLPAPSPLLQLNMLMSLSLYFPSRQPPAVYGEPAPTGSREQWGRGGMRRLHRAPGLSLEWSEVSSWKGVKGSGWNIDVLKMDVGCGGLLWALMF